jgi:carboxyl-terminal processing protease
MRLAELSDGRVIVIEVFPGFGAEQAGIVPGAEIMDWEGQPVSEALENVTPYFAPYSTLHAERQDKLVYLHRYPVGTEVEFSFQNPGESVETVTMTAEFEVDSWFASLTDFAFDELSLPIEAEILDDSGIGYIRIATFSDDYNLMAELWDRAIQSLKENEVDRLIIDARVNGGGSGGMAGDFAGYFFDHEIVIGQSSYYNNLSGTFEESPGQREIHPAPEQFEGRVAVLIGPN